MTIFRPLVVLAACLALLVSGCASTSPSPTTTGNATPTSNTRVVVDSRGVEVEVPTEIKTVATVSDAFIEEVMIALGVDAEVTAIGGTCIVREFKYDYTAKSGEAFAYTGGMNPANYLRPEMRDKPIFVADGQFNLETLAAVDPDVLIIHSGCCSVNWLEGDARMAQTLETLKGLGIPTVVVNGPNYSGRPSLDDMRSGIEVIGDVFGVKPEASKLADIIEGEIDNVVARTKDIPEAERAKVLLFGMNPNVRKEGGSGSAFGKKDVQAYMLEEFVNATNVFTSDVGSVPLNAEQVLALDPDVFVLPTSNGYHPPRELLDTNDFENLSSMRAIKNGRVAALPWSPCNCDQRLEMPVVVMVMAKAAYPDKFADVNLEAWMRDYFQRIYGVDEAQADGIISALWMDWARDE